MKYVNCYSISRHYGGSEEGGWWYDCGHPLASVPVSDDASSDVLESIRKDLHEKFGQPTTGMGRYSMAPKGDDIEIYVEDNFAEPFPQERPRFE